MSVLETLQTVLRGFAPERCQERKGFGITVIIPFRRSDKFPRQKRNFKWVKKYIKCNLPWAQVVVGHDVRTDLPFSKSAAINEAARRANGDVFVILDADGYLAIDAILYCAKKIRQARERGHKLWYVPYRQFYRLTDAASRRVLKSQPCYPYQFPTPPYPSDVQNTSGSGHGHWFGALVQIVPREAFDVCGGWDERFRGWGGEDHSAMRMTDTLYWQHKTLPGQVLHLWHPMMGRDGLETWVEWSERLWDNQETPGLNNRLATRYSRANGDVEKMRAIVNEWRNQ